MRCRLRAGVALVVLGLMWGVLFLVPFAAPWIGFGVLGLPCSFGKKGHCSNLIFGAVNAVAFWTPRSGPPQYFSALTVYDWTLAGKLSRSFEYVRYSGIVRTMPTYLV